MTPGRLVYNSKLSFLSEQLHAEVLAQGCPTSSNSSRSFSIQPEDTVYGGPTAPLPKRVTLRTLQSKYRKKQPISMVTAYDYPSAVHVSNYADQTTACTAALHGFEPYIALSSCLREVSAHCYFLACITPY